MGDWQHPAHYTTQAKEYAKRIRTAEIAIFVEHSLPSLREAARVHGYALTLHGTQERDLDLVAIPWTDDAGGIEELIVSLAEATQRCTGWGHVANSGKREKKPHGRIAVTILASADVHLDISILPTLPPKQDTA